MNSNKRRVLSAVAVGAFLTVIFTGCVLDSQKALQTETVEPAVMINKDLKVTNVLRSEKEQVLLMEKFQNLLQSKVALVKVMTFIDEHMGQISKERANTWVLELETYQKSNLELYKAEIKNMNQSQLFDSNGVLLQKGVLALPEGQAKTLLMQLDESGLKIERLRGHYEPVVDYRYAYDHYSEFTTNVIQDYLKIRSLESTKPCFDRGVLAITWQEVLDRMQGCEDFILAYPDFQNLETVKVMYFNYFRAFVYGGENTPVFKTDDGRILGDVIVVYQNMKMDDRDLISKKYLKDYFNTVQKSKFRYSSQVEAARSLMTKNLMLELKLTPESFKNSPLTVE